MRAGPRSQTWECAALRISESQFHLDRAHPSGLQGQLRERIVSAILRRRFPPGARMPATRRLAGHLGVARITISLVYQELMADGYLESRARSGVFVCDDPPGLLERPEAERISTIDWADRLAPEAAELSFVEKPEDWPRYPYPFVFGQVDEALFPLNEWRDCMRRSLGRREFHDIAADTAIRDDPRLVAYTLSHSLPARGVEAGHDELLITLGAQNALWLAVETLSRGRAPLGVAIEDPCYPELRNILRLAGADIAPIPVDDEGLDPDALPQGLDLVCVSPSHQSPTGATMSETRRRALLTRARREEFIILEDDYDFEMSFLRPPSPALKAMDGDGRVLYAGSYSKPLFPGLRLGHLVGPRPFIDAARALRSVSLRHPPGVTQRAVAHFLALGHYNAHVARLRRVFAERRGVMAAALKRGGFQLADAASHGGSSFWARAPNDLDARVLAARAMEKGVLIEPGAPFFAARADAPYFRVSYSSTSSERIKAGVAALASCLEG